MSESLLDVRLKDVLKAIEREMIYHRNKEHQDQKRMELVIEYHKLNKGEHER